MKFDQFPNIKVLHRQKLPVILAFIGLIGMGLVGCQPSEEVDEGSTNVTGNAHNESNSVNVLSDEMRIIFELIVAHEIGAARLRLQSHLMRHPLDPWAHFLFGLTFHRELRYGQARPHFEKALELAPAFADAHYFYGWCMYYLGEPEVASDAFAKRLSLGGEYADAHFGIGLINLDEGDFEAAEQRFREAIELESRMNERSDAGELSKFNARLGEALDRQGKHEEARHHLEVATSLYPDHYEAHYLLYRVLMRMGEEDAAADALQMHDEAKRRVRPEHAEPPIP